MSEAPAQTFTNAPTQSINEPAPLVHVDWLDPIPSCINPLIGAADPLFEVLYQLACNGLKPNEAAVAAFNVELRNLLVTFERQALSKGYDEQLVRAAHYALCTQLDEAVVIALKGFEGMWTTISLLSHFHKETSGGEKYFTLITHYSINPALHLHMLELLYLGIAMGFSGVYGTLVGGDTELGAIHNALYAQIRNQRGPIETELSPQWQGTYGPPPKQPHTVSGWFVMLITGLCLALIYGGLSWQLSVQRELTIQAFQRNDPARAAEFSTTEYPR